MIEWKSFGNEDIIEAFKECGHDVECLKITDKEILFQQERLKPILSSKIETYSPDFIFNFNYFPEVAIVCHELDVKYVSWIYDNPYVLVYSYTIIYPTNYIFVFDKTLFNEFQMNRIPTIYYMPLAANTTRLEAMVNNPKLLANYNASKWKNKSDIAFIGSLYNENHQFFQRMKNISEYTRGYLQGIMAAQKKVYGYNFIEKMLTKDIIADMHKDLPMEPNPGGLESVEYLYSQYVINRQITAEERLDFLSAIGQTYKYDLYTHDSDFKSKNCINHGEVDYYDMAPFVFNNTKINLNITLRSILSGIPLRAFDILGAGGFLLTNYQADFDDCYIAGEDYVYYESTEDMLGKIEFFLSHENERKEIAINGFNRTKENHTYMHRVQEFVEILG